MNKLDEIHDDDVTNVLKDDGVDNIVLDKYENLPTLGLNNLVKEPSMSLILKEFKQKELLASMDKISFRSPTPELAITGTPIPKSSASLVGEQPTFDRLGLI